MYSVTRSVHHGLVRRILRGDPARSHSPLWFVVCFVFSFFIPITAAFVRTSWFVHENLNHVYTRSWNFSLGLLCEIPSPRILANISFLWYSWQVIIFFLFPCNAFREEGWSWSWLWVDYVVQLLERSTKCLGSKGQTSCRLWPWAVLLQTWLLGDQLQKQLEIWPETDLGPVHHPKVSPTLCTLLCSWQVYKQEAFLYLALNQCCGHVPRWPGRTHAFRDTVTDSNGQDPWGWVVWDVPLRWISTKRQQWDSVGQATCLHVVITFAELLVDGVVCILIRSHILMLPPFRSIGTGPPK